MSDYISRADVLKYPIRLDHYDEVNGSREFVYGVESVIEYVESLPSAELPLAELKQEFGLADAVPTVIRAKTFMRKEDFDKWAEDIKKQNKSIVCIPCDAEVDSADAVQGEWIEVEDYNGDVHYKCDQCGEEWTFPFGTPKENNANFCPCCGAIMYKGGAEE